MSKRQWLGNQKLTSYLPPPGAGRRLIARAKARAAKMPLRWRLALVTLGLLVVLMGALGAITVFYEQQAMLTNQAAALRNEAQVAVQAAGRGDGPVTLVPADTVPPPVGPLPTDIAVRVAFLSHRLVGANTNVVIYTPDGGSVIYSSDGEPQAPLSALASPSAVQQAASDAHSSGWYMLVRGPSGQRQLAVLLPIAVDGQTVMVLQLGTPTQPIDAAIAATRLMLALGILIALVIGALLTPWLVRAALRPLGAMERTTTRISAGELSLRLREPPTNDEIGSLSRSFNRMVARLEAAFSRQKRFVADVSHELRTPLTALGGGMEMLMIGAEAGDPEASRRLMRGMYAEVERMRRLVEDLLTLTKLDEGRMRLRLERIDPGALMSGLYDQARQLTRGQEIHAEIEANLPAIQADGDRLRQVLLNLVDNALKFTPVSGTVTLRACRDGSDGVALEVEDTGAGIPAAALPHVFERFYRADPARARAHGQVGGSGLGLSIAKSLVEACGGRIAIASEEGHGTRVRARFPAQPVALPAPPPPPPPPALPAPPPALPPPSSPDARTVPVTTE